MSPGAPAGQGYDKSKSCQHVRRQSGNACKVAWLSASSTDLSWRQRSILGERTAIPLLCRLDSAIPSTPSSNTRLGVTLLTGPNFSTVVLRTMPSTLRIYSSVNPEYALANGTSVRLLLPGDGEGVIAVEAGASPMAALRIDQHGIDTEGFDFPFPHTPMSLVLPTPYRRSRALSIMLSTPISPFITVPSGRSCARSWSSGKPHPASRSTAAPRA